MEASVQEQTVEEREAALEAREADLEERLARLEELAAAAPAPAAEPADDLEAEPVDLSGTTEHGDEIGPDGRLTMPVLFRSRGRQFRAVTDPKRPFFDSVGVRIGDTPGAVCEFAPNGTYETDDPGIVAALMARPSFNLEFVRVGMEVDRPPDSRPVIDKIMQAMLDLDVPVIDEILEAETADGGHDRPDVIAACESALRRCANLDTVGD